MAHERRAFPVLVRAAAAALSLVLLAPILPGASANHLVTQQEIREARQKVKQLDAEIAAAERQLDELSARLASVTDELLAAKDRYDRVTADLLEVKGRLDETRERYAEIRDELYARARDAFIEGPGSGLEFVLGASSLTDLSDRLEFMDAVARADSELAAQVASVRNELAADEARLEQLQAEQRKVVEEVRAAQEEVQESFDRQTDLLETIRQKREQQQAYARKLSKKRQRQLEALGGPRKGVFKYCPVDQPRAFGNGFGAPRYAGGFHLHEGIDIVAPEGTPIRAPFDGVAWASTNTLGGKAVYVRGSHGEGEVYNAHLSAWSSLSNGPVRAGDIIGYVGWTGDAYGGVYHDHVEYHPPPPLIPSQWPESPYGYSVIDNSVNPYLLLVAACS
jgi:peptidoglycan hydrolase CwlO-like protein